MKSARLLRGARAAGLCVAGNRDRQILIWIVLRFSRPVVKDSYCDEQPLLIGNFHHRKQIIRQSENLF
jgi:hypothetical protein